MICKRCGCTDDKACPGGCCWVQPGICSQCVTKDATLDIHGFAKLLDGHAYGYELTDEEASLSKELGFVVVFGYSDDGTIKSSLHWCYS